MTQNRSVTLKNELTRLGALNSYNIKSDITCCTLLFEAIKKDDIATIDIAYENSKDDINNYMQNGLNVLYTAIKEGSFNAFIHLITNCKANLAKTDLIRFVLYLNMYNDAAKKKDFYLWLFENNQFKKIDRRATVAHLLASMGNVDEDTMNSTMHDEGGFTPADYLLSCGFKNISDPAVRERIIDLYEPNSSKKHIEDLKVFNLILCLFNPEFFRLLLEKKPAMLHAIDFKMICFQHTKFINSGNLGDVLCQRYQFDLFLKILIETQQKWQPADIANNKSSIHAIFKTLFFNDPEDVKKAIVKELKVQARLLIDYLLKNLKISLPLHELIAIGEVHASLATVVAIFDQELVNDILNSAQSGKCVNLNHTTPLGATLLYYLVSQASFAAIKHIIVTGNTQTINPFEKHSFCNNAMTLFGLLIQAKQWHLIEALMMNHVQWNKDNIDLTIMDNMKLESILIKEQQDKLHMKFAAIRLKMAAQDALKDSSLGKKTLTPRIPIQTVAPVLTPMQKLVAQLELYFKKLDVTYQLISTSHDGWQMILTGTDDIMHKLTTILKKHKTLKGPSPLQKGHSKSEFAPYKLSILVDLFTNNKKLEKDLLSLSIVAKKPAATVLPMLVDTKPSLRSVFSLNEEQRNEWIKILHSTFCHAMEVNVICQDNGFLLSWETEANYWRLRAPKAAHQKFATVRIDAIFIKEQFIRRIETHLAEDEGMMEKVGNHSLKFIPYGEKPLSLVSIHGQVYNHLAIPDASVTSLRLFQPFPAEMPVIITQGEMNEDALRRLFFCISKDDYCLSLSCENLQKNDRWRITLNQKGLTSHFFKLFTALQEVFAVIAKECLELHQHPPCAIFHCPTETFVLLNKHVANMQPLFLNFTAAQNIEIPKEDAQQILTPAKPSKPMPKLIDVVAYIKSHPSTIESTRTEFILALKNLNNDACASHDIPRVNLETHLQQLIDIEKESRKPHSEADQEILYYAYLLHLLRSLHILAMAVGKMDSIFQKWRDVLRHAFETKCSTELFFQTHSIILALQNLTAPLKANQLTMGEFFVPAILRDEDLAIFIEGIQPYEEFLRKRVDWQISEIEKTALLQRYLQIISNCGHSQLPLNYIQAAKPVLRSLIGHWLSDNKAYRQEYRDIGHHGFNIPIGDLLDNIMQHWEGYDIKEAPPSTELKSPRLA